MDITIKLSGLDTLAQAINNLAQSLQAGVKTSEAIDAALASSKGKKPLVLVTSEAIEQPTKKRIEQPDTLTVKPDPVPVLVPKEAQALTPELAQVKTSKSKEQNTDFVEAKDLVVKLIRLVGRDTTTEILAAFGAERVTQIAADRLPEFIAIAKKALG
jgi:hypothetical protein